MPVIGEFHAKFWRARANAPAPPGTATTAWIYPQVQSVQALHASLWGGLQVWYETLMRVWRHRRQIAIWLTRWERWDAEQTAALDRAIAVIDGPHWHDARAAVRACATTPKFHQPEQWIAYGQAIKRNKGQAQNVYRHVKVVHDLRGLDDGPAVMSNPDAHLLAELAYQGLAAMGRPGRRVIHY